MLSELSKFVSELELMELWMILNPISAIITGLFFVYFAILAISVAGTSVAMILGIHEVMKRFGISYNNFSAF
jgi:hypothetical protein